MVQLTLRTEYVQRWLANYSIPCAVLNAHHKLHLKFVENLLSLY